MTLKVFFRTCVLVGTCAAGVFAHGPQMQITGDTGRIVTREIIVEGPYSTSLRDEKSAYVMPALPFNGVYYSRPNLTPDPGDPTQPLYYSGPGIAYGYDRIGGGPRVFAEGSQFRLTFTDGFKRWNGSTFVDAGSVELEAFRGTLTAKTSDTGPFAELPFPTPGVSSTYGAEVHHTVRFRFLGDGVNPLSPSPDGVYLASLQLRSTDTAMLPSDPYFFVLHKHATDSEIMAAVASLAVDPNRVQFVPEPGVSLALLLLVLGCLRRALGARVGNRICKG